MELSHYQLAIDNAVKTTRKNIHVQALAGSAKSTTIIHITKSLPLNQQTLLTSFTKHIVDELETRVAPHIICKTLHSIGAGALMSFYGPTQLNEYKTLTFLPALLSKWEIHPKKKEQVKYNFSRLYDQMRLNLAETEEELEDLCDFHDIPIEEKFYERIMELHQVISDFNSGKKGEKHMIDFVDMIYLPIQLNLKLRQFDNVISDEAQDFNVCQSELVKRLVKPRGRSMYFGDEKQAIFAFMGSKSAIFKNIANEENTLSLPLNICYRCSQEVVREAQTIVPEIEPFSEKERGLVNRGAHIDDIKAPSMVLCRNNKPLLAMYFELVERGIKAKIKDKKIGEELLKMLKKVQGMSYDDAFCYFAENLYNEIDRLADKGAKNPENHPRIVKYAERINMLKILVDKFDTIENCISMLYQIFTDKDGDYVNLLTIHGSKGLEAENVYCIRPDLLRKVKSHIDTVVNKNLEYVMITRAKTNLYYIPKFNFNDEELYPSLKF